MKRSILIWLFSMALLVTPFFITQADKTSGGSDFDTAGLIVCLGFSALVSIIPIIAYWGIKENIGDFKEHREESKCPKCHKYGALEFEELEEKVVPGSSYKGYRNLEENHFDRGGNFTGTTQRKVKTKFANIAVKISITCKFCDYEEIDHRIDEDVEME